jgi:hypothetical protein
VNDPLLPHLLDLLSDPSSENLILGGGLGIRVKQDYIERSGMETLILELPAARATVDLDFFLNLNVFVQIERGKSIRSLLDRCQYTEKEAQWQFIKGESNHRIQVDLLASEPPPNSQIRADNVRVGKGSGAGIHGRFAPEAFAVWNMPTKIQLSGKRSNGTGSSASVLVPHPYASVNIKVMATQDWYEMQIGKRQTKPFSEKHPFDVYLLIAMMTEPELLQSKDLAVAYADHPVAKSIQEFAAELFASPDSLASVEVRRQLGSLRYEYDRFYPALLQVLGI